MSGGTARTSSLNPNSLLRFIEKTVEDGGITSEVFARRFISALFFLVFNYWAAKQWDSNKRYKGPKQDSFPITVFIKSMLARGLERDILFIYVRRVAADHYILNPTVVEIWEKELRQKFGDKIQVSINPSDLQEALRAAKEILAAI